MRVNVTSLDLPDNAVFLKIMNVDNMSNNPKMAILIGKFKSILSIKGAAIKEVPTNSIKTITIYFIGFNLWSPVKAKSCAVTMANML